MTKGNNLQHNRLKFFSLGSRDRAAVVYRDDELPPPSQTGQGQGDMAFDYHDFPSNTTDFPHKPGPYFLRLDQLYTATPEQVKDRTHTERKKRTPEEEELDLIFPEEEEELNTGKTDYTDGLPTIPRADPTTFYAYGTDVFTTKSTVADGKFIPAHLIGRVLVASSDQATVSFKFGKARKLVNISTSVLQAIEDEM